MTPQKQEQTNPTVRRIETVEHRQEINLIKMNFPASIGRWWITVASNVRSSAANRRCYSSSTTETVTLLITPITT